MGGGMPRRPKGDTTKLYKELGVEKKATKQEIRKAYRKLARIHHPDRPNGDAKKFAEIQNAYDVLYDDDKRKAYDATGDPNADPRSFGQSRRRKKKGKPTVFNLEIPLEQFYNGHTRKIRVRKTVIQKDFEGEMIDCQRCRGRGVVIIDRRLGPGMIQRMQQHCPDCEGQGKIIPPGMLKKETKVLSVFITKGMKPGEKIKFSEEGDQHPDIIPGDVIVVCRRKVHPVFKRTPEGCHLIMQKKITLLEALTGFTFHVEHLDGRILVVKSEPGKIYKSGDIKAIRDEGMPLRHEPMTRGHLYINLEVVYPNQLSRGKQRALQACLGTPVDAKAPSDDVENHELEKVDVDAEKARFKRLVADNPSYLESDDEEDNEGQGVSCRAQ